MTAEPESSHFHKQMILRIRNFAEIMFLHLHILLNIDQPTHFSQQLFPKYLNSSSNCLKIIWFMQNTLTSGKYLGFSEIPATSLVVSEVGREILEKK